MLQQQQKIPDVDKKPTLNIETHRKIKSEMIEKWGYDQALVNYLFYTNKLKNLKVMKPGQIIGFDMFSGLKYDSDKKSLYVKGSDCSPIIRHKILRDIPLISGN